MSYFFLTTYKPMLEFNKKFNTNEIQDNPYVTFESEMLLEKHDRYYQQSITIFPSLFISLIAFCCSYRIFLFILLFQINKFIDIFTPLYILSPLFCCLPYFYLFHWFTLSKFLRCIEYHFLLLHQMIYHFAAHAMLSFCSWNISIT